RRLVSRAALGRAAHHAERGSTGCCDRRKEARMMRPWRWLQVGLVLITLAVVPAGVVAVRDTGTGAGVLIIPVGASPGHVAVDARTGRAFVTNNSDNSLSVLDARSGAVLRTVT